MNNRPTLFVNSISVDAIGRENQNIFDSRKNIKGKIYHRIDDIISLISIGRKVYILVNCDNVIFYGEVIGLNKNNIFLKNLAHNFLYKLCIDCVHNRCYTVAIVDERSHCNDRRKKAISRRIS